MRIGIDCVFDGDAVAFHADGHFDFQALTNSDARSGATLVAFDVLEVEEFDFRSQSLERRRAMLAELLTPTPHGIMLSQPIEGNGADVFRHACGMGLEGIVSKRLESKYGPEGRRIGSRRRIRIGSGTVGVERPAGRWEPSFTIRLVSPRQHGDLK